MTLNMLWSDVGDVGHHTGQPGRSSSEEDVEGLALEADVGWILQGISDSDVSAPVPSRQSRRSTHVAYGAVRRVRRGRSQTLRLRRSTRSYTVEGYDVGSHQQGTGRTGRTRLMGQDID